jgi:hypothetical protein
MRGRVRRRPSLPMYFAAGRVRETISDSGNLMARDQGLEELVNESLSGLRKLTQKGMFGGWVWMLRGNLLCGARKDGMLVRLGRDRDLWALKIPGVFAMMSGARRMNGWVRASPEAYGDDKLRRKLLDAALEFNCSLPEKQ